MSSKLESSLVSAIDWLTEIAVVKNNQPIGVHGKKMPVSFWNGAVKGEYSTAKRQWDFFCPIWHTGQAVKALVMAAEALDQDDLLKKAEFSAEFIMHNRVTEGKDKGLILAYEDFPDKVNASAILECLDGLFMLSAATGSNKYCDAALGALRWVRDNSWQPEEQLFNDIYDPENKRFLFNVNVSQGRPLLDDAVFLKGWRLSGDSSFKDVAVATAETLLREENPAGNWIRYIPCNKLSGNIHPRHAYWWGMPMLDVFDVTGDERFLACYLRSVEWYKRALRTDGGFFRGTYTDFNTDSFGHATSGTACAVISFLKYYALTEDQDILQYIDKGLDFCMKMQFTKPADPDLKGAILEKVLTPDGTDHSPYYIRDLGTIFFIQAASLYLKYVIRKDRAIENNQEFISQH